MAQVLVNDNTLSSLGDLVREIKGEDKNTYKTINVSECELITEGDGEYYKVELDTSGSSYIYEATIENAAKQLLIFRFNTNGDLFPVWQWGGGGGRYTGNLTQDISEKVKKYKDDSRFNYSDYWYFRKLDGHSNIKIYTNIVAGDNPETHYTPSELVDELEEICENVVPQDMLNITGDCQYRFYFNGWNAFLEKFDSKITTNNITDMNSMFEQCYKLEKINFDINCSNSSNNHNSNNMFAYCSQLKEMPKIYNFKPYNIQNMFNNCYNMSKIDSECIESWDFSSLHQQSSAQLSGMFSQCYSLRTIPQRLIENIYCAPTSTTSNYAPYYYMYCACYVLEKLENIPVITGVSYTSNRLSTMISYCNRLKKFTFKTNEDGTAIATTWKNQLLDFTNYVGWSSSDGNIIGNNSGLTVDTKITDDTSYHALKNNPDSYTLLVQYACYNHDSAVETINSLPDTSAYGTNTIEFNGTAGSATDAGAINTLTEAEIAVASAKGWTVTLT